VVTDPNKAKGGRTLLDAVITARRWTAEECVRHFTDTATTMGEPATLSTAQLKRWRRGLVLGLPRPTACRVAEQVFGYPVEALFAPPPPGWSPAVSATRASPPSGVVATSGAHPVPTGPMRRPGTPYQGGLHHSIDLEPDPIMSAAHDASEHAADAGRAIDQTTLEQLHAEVARLAHAYAATAPAVMFAQLKRARDLTYLMLERTRRPAQISDLYLIAGQLSGLMAAVSFDLGNSDAATEQARAAFTYGQVIDHNHLRAWARATMSMIAFWSGRPSEGAAHAQAGLEQVAVGDVAVRLHAVAARSWALAGSREHALAALRAAEDAADGNPQTGDLAAVVGGEFVFGRARQELSAGATLLALGEGPQAALHAQAAIDVYETLPPDHRWTGGLHGARVDLATAQLLASDLDAVQEVLAPTLALAAEHRTERVVARVRALRHKIAAKRFRESAKASSLAEELEAFANGHTLRVALPGGND
jgi:hypothetical protein